jgi:DNA invertase Pin-like site-specific DNA recombinase
MARHVAIYVRVSSKQQDQASQLPDLERWAAGQTDEVVWYRDKASGKSMDRPAWNKLQAAINCGKVSKVVCWRLDRLGRTAKGLTALFEDLSSRRIGLVSIKDGLDLSTAAGRLMANVLASVAAYETEIRAERVLAGQAVARANGKTWGGSEKGRRIKVTTEQIDVVRRLRAENAKVTAMASATGLSRPTIYSVLASL